MSGFAPRLVPIATALLAGSLLAISAPSLAATTQSSGRRSYRASRAEAPPLIDGRLDDRCWAGGEWEGGFTQREPFEGQAPSEPTDFQIVFDDEHLFVAIRAHDREPDRIESRVTRRDDRQGDQVEIYFDSYLDHRTAFLFNVNSAGVKTDSVLSEDGARIDDSWDAVWHARTRMDGKGWTAELSIPFDQMRFGAGQPRIWGLQVRRRLHRREEMSEWQIVSRDASGLVSWFGELRGLDEVSPRRHFELLPYAVSKLERYEVDEEDPFSTGGGENLTAGLDGKIAAASDLTVSFTVNPDFGQVEADPSEVNLSTFETFFAERRPFFIEGANILDFPLMEGDGGFARDNLFYSRRIGRPPQRALDLGEDDYLSAPPNTTIYGAAKLTGKTPGGWSLGLLDAVTSAEYATLETLGERRREAIEPFTHYLVARVQRDFRRANTSLGGMFTATNRDGENAEISELHRSAYTGGLDLRHSWRERRFSFSARAVFSSVHGDPAALLATQRSARRYFQRPDAGYLELRPDRTSLSGHGGTVSIGKYGGGHLRFSAGGTWRSPGLELNDAGFLRAADQAMQWSYLGWRVFQPFAVFRTLDLHVNQWRGWDFGGTNLFDGGNVNLQMQLRNYWFVGMGLHREGESISNVELRGGPSLRMPGGWSQWLNLRSDSRRRTGFYAGGFRYRGDGSSESAAGLWLGTTLRPVAAASITLEPSWVSQRRTLQYVETVAREPGDRFVFGSLDQTTFALTLRLSYSVTPDLSIQFYGQPFLSSGDYEAFKRITSPRAERYRDRFEDFPSGGIAFDPSQDEYLVDESGNVAGPYRFSNPDFDVLQLRSNLVLRWEYRPGSTLYVVWSQDRTGDGEREGFSVARGLSDLYRVPPYNVFLVKLSYRFSL